MIPKRLISKLDGPSVMIFSPTYRFQAVDHRDDGNDRRHAMMIPSSVRNERSGFAMIDAIAIRKPSVRFNRGSPHAPAVGLRVHRRAIESRRSFAGKSELMPPS
jgi:hypothetical protein